MFPSLLPHRKTSSTQIGHGHDAEQRNVQTKIRFNTPTYCGDTKSMITLKNYEDTSGATLRATFARACERWVPRLPPPVYGLRTDDGDAARSPETWDRRDIVPLAILLFTQYERPNRDRGCYQLPGPIRVTLGLEQNLDGISTQFYSPRAEDSAGERELQPKSPTSWSRQPLAQSPVGLRTVGEAGVMSEAGERTGS